VRTTKKAKLKVFKVYMHKMCIEKRIIMNILTYIAIAIGGFVAIGSTLSITLGIFGTIIYKIIRSIRYRISLFD
jgi:hypothetical protein